MNCDRLVGVCVKSQTGDDDDKSKVETEEHVQSKRLVDQPGDYLGYLIIIMMHFDCGYSRYNLYFLSMFTVDLVLFIPQYHELKQTYIYYNTLVM